MYRDSEQGNSALIERCQGFEDGRVTFIGRIDTASDSRHLFKEAVETAVGQSGDWEAIGLLTLSSQLVGSALELKASHPKILLATFDTSTELFDALETGQMLFGIDQVPYLQGYMPVWLLMTVLWRPILSSQPWSSCCV
jgi:simple sugar transport system substrate-binding protein